MTGNYWVAAPPESSVASYFGVTGVDGAADVTVKLGPMAAILGGAVAAAKGGGTVTFHVEAGDVVQIVSSYMADLGGTRIEATGPVQVIAGTPCSNMPNDSQSCDHLEEVVLPTEVLGKEYHVAVPTGPEGMGVTHVVRLYGTDEPVALTYDPAAPMGAPAMLGAGEMVDLRLVEADFAVKGDKPFAVGTFMVSKQVLYPGAVNANGDPSQSTYAAREQYRLGYVFLSPDDYPISYADVTAPMDAKLMLDGADPGTTAIPIGTSGYGVHRIKLGAGKGGVHQLTATSPVGLQVIGYDLDTSYQYPGGLNLKKLATAGP